VPEEALADARPREDREREHERQREAISQLARDRVHRVARVAALAMPAGIVRSLDRGWVAASLWPVGLMKRVA
jgi:hypothetical protein